ncbi:MAG: hypothetical protein ACI857_000909 [Arenicella sp.]|jgi:hypothetical protein
MKFRLLIPIIVFLGCAADPTEDSLDDQISDTTKIIPYNSLETDSIGDYAVDTSFINKENCFEGSTIIEVEDIAEIGIDDIKNDGSKNGAVQSPFEKMITIPSEEIHTQMSHELWNDLLEKYVSSKGKVNYFGLKSNKSFDQYLAELAANHPIMNGVGMKKWPIGSMFITHSQSKL